MNVEHPSCRYGSIRRSNEAPVLLLHQHDQHDDSLVRYKSWTQRPTKSIIKSHFDSFADLKTNLVGEPEEEDVTTNAEIVDL